jgi:hypothetical protein
MKNLFVSIVVVLFAISAQAQYRNKDGNRIGISAGIAQTSLLSSNFNAKPEMGFAGGLSVRGNYYNDFSMTFGMQFFNNNFSLETVNASFKKEDVKYTVEGVQVRLILSYNLIEDHLALDFGPVLQVNGKLKIDKDNENNIFVGAPLLKAADIVDVAPIHGNLQFGISGGSKVVKLILCYQYGMDNFFNKLNKDDELVLKNNGKDFKGHLGTLSAQILISL